MRNSTLSRSLIFSTLAFHLVAGCLSGAGDQEPHFRINQLGYLPGEEKSALLFSEEPFQENVEVIDQRTGRSVFAVRPEPSDRPNWGRFDYYYLIDFSPVREPGNYYLEGERSGIRSPSFGVSESVYRGIQDTLLVFMRQQRCGYNPFLDMVCHQLDGKSAYGPMSDSTWVEVTGGWHDAGDQLKYLITASYATAHMLLAFEMYPERFGDRTDASGRPFPNGIPDVLDEAKWGLDWIHKLHPAPDQLIHQVADDRDHVGWKMPDEDPSDYGWGPGSYRVAYFATGEPQGLSLYQSRATGVSNLAGRSAAAMALAARIWTAHLGDTLYAGQCLRDARTLYRMGREKEGYQQGNSYGAPYRYGEESWADDMEWGAAELYKTTSDPSFLEEARRYAGMAGTVSWMPHDTALHYQYYPFINMGHYVLHGLVEGAFRDTLAAWYRSGIEDCLRRGSGNPYEIGVPFIWCSNNLLTGLITQMILYERMTGDPKYQPFLIRQRDWLFGRNPWGTSMFTGIPGDGEFPEDVHTSIRAVTGREVSGGLVDGPVYGTIFRSLAGLSLTGPDEFGGVQNEFVVYHDDIGDYSTNEPTMDGTAGAILMITSWSGD
ncbi:MAG: glycoside hydrolase family 9 protein [Bacteroidales bacterium]